MSAYYYFTCRPCKQYGGFLSRQAWGWGNFDIVDSFRFLAKHINSCGVDGIGMASELEMPDWAKDDKIFANTAFPRSDDWLRIYVNSPIVKSIRAGILINRLRRAKRYERADRIRAGMRAKFGWTLRLGRDFDTILIHKDLQPCCPMIEKKENNEK